MRYKHRVTSGTWVLTNPDEDYPEACEECGSTERECNFYPFGGVFVTKCENGHRFQFRYQHEEERGDEHAY